MSVLIKGMRMPEKCGCCKLFHAEYPMHCTAIKEYRTASAPYGMSRPDWCPLVEIKTPHGRLIDVDALKLEYRMKDDCNDCEREMQGSVKACEYDTVYTKMNFCEWLDDAPTVIEAEEDWE